MLFDNVYSRLSTADITVLADCNGRAGVDERRGSMTVLRRPVAAARWGVLHPAALRHHLRTASTLRSVVNRKPAVVHCARPLPEGLAAWLPVGTRRPPYICWTHGEELAYARTSRELVWLTRVVYRHATAVIANSRYTAGKVQALGTAPEKIKVVHPGVDASQFRESDASLGLRRRLITDGEVLVLSVGRLQRRKGHDLMIRAMATLRGHSPGLRYVIVGGGDERPRLEALVAECGVADRVTFEGEVDAGVLPAYYSACDIFAMPNRVDGVDVEGFGIVFLEAAAAGRPTIGGRSGGVPEAIDDGRTGLLVSGTDVAELAAAVSRLANSHPMRVRMGEAGCARVVREFSWDRAAAQVTDIHRSVAASL